MIIAAIQCGIYWVTVWKDSYQQNFFIYSDREKSLHQMTLIPMDHTHGANDLLDQKLIFRASKHARDVSYYSANMEE
jgi:hypothetical protein